MAHHREAQVECVQCNRRFLKHKLPVHMNHHVDPVVFSCDSCPFTAKTRRDLKTHIARVHLKVRTKQCNYCYGCFFNQKELKVHMKSCKYVPEEEKPKIQSFKLPSSKPPQLYKCQFCDATFANIYTRRSHEEVHRNSERNISFPCQVCEKVYPTLKHLNRHRIFHGLRKYKCDLCQKGFSHKKQLHSHLFIHLHLGVVCKICNKVFKSKFHLKNHQKKRPIKPKKYQCDICGVMLASKKSAVEHRLIHKDEKPHTCTKCGARFRSYSSIMRHDSDVHQGKKAYQCKLCDKSFSQGCSLKRHINDVHEKIKAHKCDICGWSFAQKSGLKSHKARCERNLDSQDAESKSSS